MFVLMAPDENENRYTDLKEMENRAQEYQRNRVRSRKYAQSAEQISRYYPSNQSAMFLKVAAHALQTYYQQHTKKNCLNIPHTKDPQRSLFCLSHKTDNNQPLKLFSHQFFSFLRFVITFPSYFSCQYPLCQVFVILVLLIPVEHFCYFGT